MNQIGIYNLPGNKALEIFTKLKRKAKETERIPQSPLGPIGESTPIIDIEPNNRGINKSL